MARKVIGKDKMDDDIVVNDDSSSNSLEIKLKPLEGMCYVSLSDHFRSKCESVLIDCNSCKLKFTRCEFRLHKCFLQIKEINHDVLEN